MGVDGWRFACRGQQNPAPDSLKATCMQAAVHAEEQGVPLPKLALKHSIKSAADSGIAVTLVGMSGPEEVSQSISECVGQNSQIRLCIDMHA